jgi:RNA polymerase sigma factor (sigma-70 family)
MAIGHLDAVLRHIRKLAGVPASGDVTDGGLLERFVTERDQAAFELLVRRHERMVWGVCRRLLANSHDAEDAFQAAFVVLVRKAGTVRKRESLGCWLHQVAYRVALRASARRARITGHEQQVLDPESALDPHNLLNEVAWREVRPILDQELSRLPEKYRAPVVLCYLQGKSYEEAAQQLGCSKGTLSTRLTRARELLRGRLSRRGLSLTVGLLATALAQEAASGAVPVTLITSSVRNAAVLGIQAAALGSGGPAPVASLAADVVHALFLTKLKLAVAFVLAVSVIGAGAGLVAQHTLAAKAGWEKQPAGPQSVGQRPAEPKPRTAEQARTDFYGDPLPPGAVARLGTMRFRHGQQTPAALSPDGKMLATATIFSLKLWDVPTGKLLWQLGGKSGAMMRFSPNGKWLAVGGNLLDAASGQLILRFPGWGHTTAFSPDSTLFADGSRDGTIILWHTTTGKEVGRLKSDAKRVSSCVFTPDGMQLIAWCDGNRIYWWDVASAKLLRTVEVAIGNRQAWALSPDGRTLAAIVYGTHEPVSLWDTETGKERCRLQGEGAYTRMGLAFSPDSRTLATDLDKAPGDDAQISVWDAGTGRLLRRFAIPYRALGGDGYLQWAADNRTVLTSGAESHVRLWDSVTGKSLFEYPAHDSLVRTLAFVPDGKTLVSGSRDGTIRVWDVATGRHLRELTGHKNGTSQVAVLNEGRTILSAGFNGHLLLQNIQTGKELHRMIPDLQPEDPKLPYRGSIPVFAVSTDGRTAASFRSPQQGRDLLHIWDLATGRALVSRTEPLGAPLPLFSPDARLMARQVPVGIPSPNRIAGRAARPNKAPTPTPRIAEAPGTLQIVVDDVATGKHLLTLPLDYTTHSAFSPDSRTLLTITWGNVGQRDGQNIVRYTCRLWELASGKERLTLGQSEQANEAGTIQFVQQILFAPDGRSVAVAFADGTIRILDTATGQERLRRSGYDSRVHSLAFAPDGKSLASGHEDSTILIWNLMPELSRRAPIVQASRQQLESWWTDLAGPDAPQAHVAIWKLVASPEQTLPLLRERLHPVAAIPANELRTLLADLDSNQFDRRQAAWQRLTDLEEQAEPILRQALQDNPSLEKRRRIESLLSVPRVVKSPDKLRDLRAVEVLEQIGTAEAREILKSLAKGAPEARLTQEANASLDRLAMRPAKTP